VIGAITAGTFSAGVAAATNSYESIATVTLGSSTSSISFSSIPATFKHLQVRGILRSPTGTNVGGGKVTFNSDTTSGNYTFHRLIGDGSSASSYGQSGIDFILRCALNSTTSGIFGASVVDILDYANTSKYKTTRVLTGADTNDTNGIVGLFSQLWMNTAAITTITITPSEANFSQYSQLALYGIKG
jgi:hypothetical protein